MHLVFFDDREQVFSWHNESASAATKLVAVTAEALQALEERGLPHEAVSAYADLRQRVQEEERYCRDCFLLAQEIESFIGERFEPARFQGPGFLTSNAYYLQFAVCVVATRALLIREVLRVHRPEQITVLSSSISFWFSGDGYSQNPWIEALQTPPSKSPSSTRGGDTSHRYRNARGSPSESTLPRADGAVQPKPTAQPGRTGLRLLMAHSQGYDWSSVLARLLGLEGSECLALEGVFPDKRDWPYYYRPVLQNLNRGEGVDLGSGLPQADAMESETLANLFDEWERRRASPPELNVLGMNLYPALRRHIRGVTCQAPALARHADAVALRALEIANPDAVCFFAMPWLSAKRLAYQARQRGIPVICYEHGASYGTHSVPAHEQTELSHADYFLTYGTGVRPPDHPFIPVRARYVPVGSTRLEAARRRSLTVPRQPGFTLLWIGEYSSGNTFTGIEDTGRYSIQKQCLEILSKRADFRIIYRPFPGDLKSQATPRWIALANSRSIWVEATQPLDSLLRVSDLVICDSSSCNAFNEALALGKPTLLFLDPTQVLLLPEFRADLERACYWCQTREAFVAAVRRLVLEGEGFIDELRQIDTSDFLVKYMLHRDDGRCVERVTSFLLHVCRDRLPLDRWEGTANGEPRDRSLEDGTRPVTPKSQFANALDRLNERWRASVSQ